MATQTANIKKLRNGRKVVMTSVKNVHNNVIETAETLIEESVISGVKYQKMAVKAIKKTEPLIDKQVDIVFDTLENIYDQFEDGNKRFQKLLGITKTVKKVKSSIKKTIKATAENIENTTDKFKKTAEKVEDNFEIISKKFNKVADKVEDKIKEVANATTDKVVAAKPIVKKAKKITRKPTTRVKAIAKKVASNKKMPSIKAIKGVGPKMEKVFKASGIASIQDLAKANVKEVKAILENAGPAFKNYNANEWIKSAKALLR